MNKMHIRPGDWHASMTMLQSVSNVFWDGFLEHFKFALKWQRCGKDVRNTYFSNCKLTHLVYEVCSSFLLHSFVSSKHEQLKESFEKEEDKSHSNYVCHVASEFSRWLIILENGDDDWLKCCAMFIRMAKDLFTFIDSFRRGDAIGIETGYELFVVVWRALGQHRYEARHWKTQEETYIKFPFHCMEWMRRSCSVNPYNGKHGKHMIAYDEMLELMNRFLKLFPMCSNRDRLAEQSNMIGPAKGAKRFISQLMLGSNDPKVFKSSRILPHEKEKKVIYEMFMLLGTSKQVSGRKFNRMHVKNVIDQCKSRKRLRDMKIEQRIKGKESHQAYSFLSSISQIMDDVELTFSPASEELESVPTSDKQTDAEKAQRAKEREQDLARVMDDDAGRTSIAVLDEPEVTESKTNDDKVAENLGYSRWMITNVWVAGRKRLSNANIQQKRAGTRTRIARNVKVNKVLIAERALRVADERTQIEKPSNIPAQLWTSRIRGMYPEHYSLPN